MVKLVERAHGYKMNPVCEECSPAFLGHETFFLSHFGMNDFC